MVNCYLGGVDWVKMSELLFQGVITALLVLGTFKLGQINDDRKWRHDISTRTIREQIDVLTNIVNLREEIYKAAHYPSTENLGDFLREKLEWDLKNYKITFSEGSEITEQLDKLSALIIYIPQGPLPISGGERHKQSEVIIDDLIARIKLLRSKIEKPRR